MPESVALCPRHIEVKGKVTEARVLIPLATSTQVLAPAHHHQGFTYRPVRPNRYGPVPVYRSGLAGNRSVPVEVKFEFKFRSSNGSYRYTGRFGRYTGRFDW